MLGMACQWRNDRFVRIDSELEAWLKRNVSDPQLKDNLFVYRAMDVGTFVIGLWMRPGWFVDILNLGHSLSGFTRSVAQGLLVQLAAPTSADDTRRWMRTSESNYYHTMQDQNEAAKERLHLC